MEERLTRNLSSTILFSGNELRASVTFQLLFNLVIFLVKISCIFCLSLALIFSGTFSDGY